jgi:hypothetical protein
MKKLLASFGWILLLLPALSFAGIRTTFSNINSAWFETENRPVGPFSSVSSSGSFDVYIKMGQQESLRLEGSKDLISRIETVVENGDLKIRLKKNNHKSWRFGVNEKVRVYVTAKALKSVNMSGSGDMKVDGIIKGENFQSRLSGSGSIKVNVNVSNYLAAISGSGELTAWGSAKNTDISVSGSGNFKGEKLQTSAANVKVSGSGDVSIHADQSLNAAVSGSGDVYYAGNARVNSKTSGSGNVKRL